MQFRKWNCTTLLVPRYWYISCVSLSYRAVPVYKYFFFNVTYEIIIYKCTKSPRSMSLCTGNVRPHSWYTLLARLLYWSKCHNVYGSDILSSKRRNAHMLGVGKSSTTVDKILLPFSLFFILFEI